MSPNRRLDAIQLGVVYALCGFGLWGVFPIYFKALGQVPAVEVLAHRIVWSVALLGVVMFVKCQLPALMAEWRDRRRLGFHLATTVLISANWLTYIWAVQHDRVLEASLGYYINPLVSVVLGVVFLHERLSSWQLLAVALAGVGVLIMVIGYGAFPWVSLMLALSFGSYGLLRKKVGVDAMLGLFIETLLLAPLALLFLSVLAVRREGALGTVDLSTDLLLLSAGVATVVPLVMFLEATQRLRLSTVGLLQYVTPTLQFLLAVMAYHEPFTSMYLITFSCIWVALGIYSWDALSGR